MKQANPIVTRRDCLRFAIAATALPLAARAGCPCAGDDDAQDATQQQPQQPAQLIADTTDAPPLKSLRICADPDNLPYSNRAREGFEDKIAAIVAQELGVPLEYYWLPQRLGFYRTALKTFDSNLVMAAPGGFEKALISDPYYQSTYVFVSRKGAKTKIKSLDDPEMAKIKIGVPLTGGDNTPPTYALAKRKLIDNITGYPAFDEDAGKPGEKIIAAVASGEIDLAIVWGPQAGYFAKRQTVALEVTPVAPAEDAMGDVKMPFTFKICMALRRPDKPLRARINEVIAKRQKEIDQILDEYGVPRLPLMSSADGTAFGPSPKADR